MMVVTESFCHQNPNLLGNSHLLKFTSGPSIVTFLPINSTILSYGKVI